MTCTVDANVLLYAADNANPQQDRARQAIRGLAEGPAVVYLFWPVILAYLRISTRPNLFRQPLSMDAATSDIGYLLSMPNVRNPSEDPGFWDVLSSVITESRPRGNLLTDAHIVALMRQHGVSTIYTHDRDFRKFDGIHVVDPFV